MTSRQWRSKRPNEEKTPLPSKPKDPNDHNNSKDPHILITPSTFTYSDNPKDLNKIHNLCNNCRRKQDQARKKKAESDRCFFEQLSSPTALGTFASILT